MYTGEDNGRLVVGGVATDGPADTAGVQPGDVVVDVAGKRVAGLADLFRSVWRQGPAGTRSRWGCCAKARRFASTCFRATAPTSCASRG
jgi:C-terminal processing protease CtpA/Prc